MSGTSLDGIDVALIETDGYDYAKPLAFYYEAYLEEHRIQIRKTFGQKNRTDQNILDVEALLTRQHAKAVKKLLSQENLTPDDIDYIGFHGQTIYHAPQDKLTIQLGDGDLLAKETGINVIYDFRTNDVMAGGEGAPLAPIYHRALAQTANLKAPFAILNIGGVSNVTWIGKNAGDILAFDTGPGNALMDDWMQKHTNDRYDQDGNVAASGQPHAKMIKLWLDHTYFQRNPPKSLDRNEWDISDFGQVSSDIDHISVEDGAATLLHFTAQSILKSIEYMPEEPKVWYVCGGGRHNKALMKLLSAQMNIQHIDDLGWNGDAIEAECFAYLAIRNILNLPLSFPTTTRVTSPLSGGRSASAV